MVPIAPSYAVSDQGRVKRVGPACGALVGHILRPLVQRSGHHTYLLRVNGRYVRRTVNWLVAWAFHGPPPAGKRHAAHRDGNPANNQPGNIYWATVKENAQDTLRHGRKPMGERHYRTHLTTQDVRAIRAAAQAGVVHRELAARYAVTASNIGVICRNESWRHV